MTSNATYTVTVLLDVNPIQDIDDRAESRTYIVADRDSGKAVIIDAVIENVDRDLKTIKELGLILTFSVETHIHADHITGVSMIKDRTGARIVYGGGVEGFVTGVDMFLHDGQELCFGNTTMKALATPGHTDSCTSYVLPGSVFTGGLHVDTRQWPYGFSGRVRGEAFRLRPHEAFRAAGCHDRLSRSRLQRKSVIYHRRGEKIQRKPEPFHQ